MKTKLNKLERFCLSNYKVMTIGVYVLVIVILVVCLFATNSPFVSAELAILTLACFMPIYIVLLVLGVVEASFRKKIKSLGKKYNNCEVGPYEALNAYDHFINNTDLKMKSVIIPLCINRTAALWSAGEYSRLEYELLSFLNTFNMQKINDYYKMIIHVRLAEVSFVLGNYDQYNENVKAMHYIMNSNKNKYVKNALNRLYSTAMLFIDAYTANKNSDEIEFEARAFGVLNTSPLTAKPRKKQATAIEYLSTCYKLFLFFKNTENIEKAKFYAIQIVNMSNEQYVFFRSAKEFLDNENRSN